MIITKNAAKQSLREQHKKSLTKGRTEITFPSYQDRRTRAIILLTEYKFILLLLAHPQNKVLKSNTCVFLLALTPSLHPQGQ